MMEDNQSAGDFHQIFLWNGTWLSQSRTTFTTLTKFTAKNAKSAKIKGISLRSSRAWRFKELAYH